MRVSEEKLRDLIRRRLLKERSDRASTRREERREDRRERRRERRETLSGEDTQSVPYTPLSTDKPVGSNVKLNQMQINAWNWLSPALPDGARMTSGLRTQADQERIINNYARREGITGSIQSKWQQLKSRGFVIARRIGRGHGSGESFDVSGANLQDIKRAVESVTGDQDKNVKFAAFGGRKYPSIVEDENNAVHVHIDEAGQYESDSDS